MTKPLTLLELSHATPRAASLADATVVVIDAQREYVDGFLVLPGVDEALQDIHTLLSRARRATTPIVHIQHAGAPGGAFDPQGPGFAFAPGAEPHTDEPVVQKNLPDAFAGTNLEDILQGFGRTSLLIVGFMTHMCVTSTTHSARSRGFANTIIARATATRALPGAQGGVIDDVSLKQVSLSGLADFFAVIVEDTAAITDQP